MNSFITRRMKHQLKTSLEMNNQSNVQTSSQDLFIEESSKFQNLESKIHQEAEKNGTLSKESTLTNLKASIPIPNFSLNKESSTGSENNKIAQGQNKTENSVCRKPKMPMDDEEGPFYIDREIFDVDLYQEGLQVNKWNPTQVVFEICSQCRWEVPDFNQVDLIVNEGFLYSVRVNDVIFIAKKRGKKKKNAKHLASTAFLQFLGFKFSYEPFERRSLVLNFNSNRTNYERYDLKQRKRVVHDELELSSHSTFKRKSYRSSANDCELSSEVRRNKDIGLHYRHRHVRYEKY